MSWNCSHPIVGFLPDPTGGDPILAKTVAANIAADQATLMAESATALALASHQGFAEAINSIDAAKTLWIQVVIEAQIVLTTNWGGISMAQMNSITNAANAYKQEAVNRVTTLHQQRAQLVAAQAAAQSGFGQVLPGGGGLGPAPGMHPIVPPGTITPGPSSGPSSGPIYMPPGSGYPGPGPILNEPPLGQPPGEQPPGEQPPGEQPPGEQPGEQPPPEPSGTETANQIGMLALLGGLIYLGYRIFVKGS